MEPLKIAVCEDDDTEYRKLNEILESCGYNITQERFQDGSGLVEQYFAGRYDLLLIDIYMEGMNGIETVARIRDFDPDVPIAFLTTSVDHALEGYRYHVDRYINKPLRTGDIAEMLHRAVQIRDTAPAVSVPFGGKVQRIPLSRIRYLESQGSLVYFYLTGGGVEKTTAKLKEIALMLPQPPFFVCHKSYAVNLQYVAVYDKEMNVFELREGGRAYIRRESKAAAGRAYRDYMFDFTRKQGEK